MDGLQVLSITKRTYPQVRVVVLTSVEDEEFRARAYGMGVDQYWRKADSVEETELFLGAMADLLEGEQRGGFRGVQSKSLVDILQLEALAQSSGVLRIISGLLEGRIWMLAGELIAAETQELRGEEAFRRIMTWKSGSFEILSAEPSRPRDIHASLQSLLLEAAQAVDEAHVIDLPSEMIADGLGEAVVATDLPKLAAIGRIEGVEFVLAVHSGKDGRVDSWGLEAPSALADYFRKVSREFEGLGAKLHAGRLNQVVTLGTLRHVAVAPGPSSGLCVGLRVELSIEEVRSTMKTVLSRWAS
jgi:CheY-like chemotaxis protein